MDQRLLGRPLATGPRGAYPRHPAASTGQPAATTRDPTRHLPGRERARSRGTSRHEHHRPTTHQAPPQSATPPPIAAAAGSASPGRPTWGAAFDRTAPLIGAPAFFGPPIIFVLGPWLLLVLLLIGPFALIFTLVLVTAAAAGLLAGS